MATVKIYIQRHGEKGKGPNGNNDLALLTPEGELEVETVAWECLRGIKFSKLCCSYKPRALQTVVTALMALPEGNQRLGIDVRLGLDYEGCPDDEYYAALKLIPTYREQHRSYPSVQWWFEQAPKMMGFLRPRITTELSDLALMVAGSDCPDDFKANILGGSHGPLSEIACLNPRNTHSLGLGGIILYTMDINEGSVSIAKSEVLHPGF